MSRTAAGTFDGSDTTDLCKKSILRVVHIQQVCGCQSLEGDAEQTQGGGEANGAQIESAKEQQR